VVIAWEVEKRREIGNLVDGLSEAHVQESVSLIQDKNLKFFHNNQSIAIENV
jgi:hypothetical protein